VLDEAVGGAGALDGDQQVPAVPGRDLGDRLLEYVKVIGRGVGAGAAGAQQQCQ
jgi:hypothetical protein